MAVAGFLWRSVALAAGLGAVATLGAWALLGDEFALGIALGTVVAHASFVGLARDLSTALGVAAARGERTLGGPADEIPPRDGEIPAPARDPAQIAGLDGARQIRARSLLKWPLVGLALAGILWYMPARPEGVALGVVLSLAAAVLAALFEPRSAAPPEGPAAPPQGG
jgi:hypothetical protein